ncbi:MAG: O-antigen ligase family protein [Saprospiraceae bacterium]|nr:O-antigen ligase family protein [Saprospiraceae bacterium]
MKQAPHTELRWVRQCSQTTVFFAMLIVVSMMLSPFLLSIGIWGLLFCALWHSALLYRNTVGAIPLSNPMAWFYILKQGFERLFRHRAGVLMLILLVVPFVSGLWSADTHYWLDRVRVRVPFLVLPFVFVNLPPLSRTQFRLVLYVLVWALVLMCIGIGLNYFLNEDTILQGLREGRPIPVPRQHIRFSLILCTGIVAGAWLWLKRFVWRFSWERNVLGGALIFLFFFQHFLAVRSGLAALYAVLLFTLARYVWNSRQWMVGIGALVIFGAMLVAALQFIPSLSRRVDYMVHDWHMFRNHAGQNYSDSERWISLETGVELWQSAPLFGVGAGDLPVETEKILAEDYPQYVETPKLPHNQFIYLLAGTGIVGLFLSMIVFLYPLLVPVYRRFYPFLAHQVVIFTSFLVEYTIETSIGVAFYLFYTFWYMNMAVAEKQATS